MYRQGDLLFIPVETDPQLRGRWKKVDSGILALGEATGHAHQLIGGDAYTGGWSGDMRIVAFEGARVEHPEHDTIVLPEGEYFVRRQRQWGDGGVRTVAD